MRKYHIADILVLIRFVLAALLLVLGLMTPFDWTHGHVLGVGFVLFVVAELTDAFDGPAARRWHYPSDGKHRWWRENGMNVLLDKVADLATAVMMSILLWRHVPGGWSLAVVMVGVAVTVYCLTVEIEVRSSFDLARKRGDRFWQKRFGGTLLRRRGVYLLYLVWIALLALWTSDYHLIVKLAISLGGVRVLTGLAGYKRDRLTEVDTEL